MLRRFIEISRSVGVSETLRYCFAKVTKRERPHILSIDGTNVEIRTGTSDLLVVISSLVEPEYASIRSSNPKIIIDAGANIGASSIYFAKRFPNARIIALEPEASNFEALVRNVRPFSNVTPVNKALTAHDGKGRIVEEPSGKWAFRVFPLESDDAIVRSVDCISVETLMQSFAIDSIDILKLDIEGGERSLLEGRPRWVDRIDVIAAELHDNIVPGCLSTFLEATDSFAYSEQNGEKLTRYRKTIT